ncbi:MAG: DUF1572 family protein [Acidobacteria bacterium]|nr:DUF1572 family protein [Acidobacteriota bacterium]
MSDSNTFAHEFLRISRHQLRERLRRIELCVAKLDDGQLWTRSHETENAVGNLILHLAGNIRQWIVSGVGGAPDRRNRDAEFAQREPLTREQAMSALRDAIADADAVLASLSEEDLLVKRKIQVFDLTLLHAIYHCIEHLAEHSGQIVWATKRMTGEDLRIYAYLNDPDRKSPQDLIP